MELAGAMGLIVSTVVSKLDCEDGTTIHSTFENELSPPPPLPSRNTSHGQVDFYKDDSPY